jgi:hypothetical protein
VLIVFGSLRACRRVRLAARRGEVPDELGRYAIAFETALVAFMVGGSFVSFQYCEMLWHYFVLTIALERVAVRVMAKARERHDEPVAATPSNDVAEPEFAWG